ncbi:hypothetical protein GOV08_02705, partial [Candidatus Woesearchaeota archaeon]|nr:hypothetical protein [Candidatus Woesearchaeota archaeon]
MKINELEPKTGDVNLTAIVKEIGEVREFEKGGAKGRFAKAIIKDESGECKMTLWNEQVDEVTVGAKIKIFKGWADEWKGEMEVSTGKFGELEVLESDAKLTNDIKSIKEEKSD